MKKLLVFLLFTFSLACLGQSVSVKHSTKILGSNQTQVEVLILPTAIAQVSEVCLNFKTISYVLLSLDSVVTKFNDGIELYVYDLSNHNINQWAEFNYSWASTSTGTQMMDTIKIYFKAWNQGTTPLKWQNSSISNSTGQINCTFLDGLINVPPLTRVRGAVFYSSDQVTVVPGSTITAWGQWQKHYHSWTTNAYGYYEIDLPRDCYNISVSGPGDMGAVNTSDALAVMRDFAGVQSLPQNRKVAGDVNASGSLNTTDALYIAKYFVGHPIFSPTWYNHFDQVRGKDGQRILTDQGTLIAGREKQAILWGRTLHPAMPWNQTNTQLLQYMTNNGVITKLQGLFNAFEYEPLTP